MLKKIGVGMSGIDLSFYFQSFFPYLFTFVDEFLYVRTIIEHALDIFLQELRKTGKFS